MNLVESKWELYRREVIPPTATPLHINECRRAFYCGISALYTILMEDPDITDQDLQSISIEIKDFISSMIRGRV